ncbi:hypothetical protein BN946_scf185028.g8 [Trametes cinnabarina]|uniref:Uncharacterized protein n=1 Tax=Pycnoporus cinnabarinus TaxID=5643 RepID=A0A060SQE1_PYCCI|nr:hypothetical protein BN946_scf185028.g8 [Trametes cinnabarina]
MRPILAAAFFALFAGQGQSCTALAGEKQPGYSCDASALAFLQINITAPVGSINASQFLTFDDPVLTTQCGDANDACLCSNATVTAIVACEQCMFNELIAQNRAPQDPRAGQTAAISAYASACSAALTKDKIIPSTNESFVVLDPKLIALTPPPFNGPFEQILSTGGTVVSVIAATVLGSGLIGVLVTM